jgi:hypothetical protein
MKKKTSPSVPQRDHKQETINRARKGGFNRNPLLATPHQVVCKACGFAQKIIYLDYIKSGKFVLGETRLIQVSYAAPTVFGLSHTIEKRTPIIMTVRCKRCGTEVSCSPGSLEYLLFTATKKQKLKNMYV